MRHTTPKPTLTYTPLSRPQLPCSLSDGPFDEDAEHLNVKQRVALECGVLHHDAHLTTADTPTRHTSIPSAAHHHQTADALTHLPAPKPPEAAAAVAAASAGGGGGGGTCGASESAAAAAVASVVEVPPEDVVVSCKGVLSVYRLETGKVSANSSCSDVLIAGSHVGANMLACLLVGPSIQPVHLSVGLLGQTIVRFKDALPCSSSHGF
jgi:hypothetical protein